jgi:hypothetical protein
MVKRNTIKCLLIFMVLQLSGCSSSLKTTSDDVMQNLGLSSKEFEKFDVKPIDSPPPQSLGVASDNAEPITKVETAKPASNEKLAVAKSKPKPKKVQTVETVPATVEAVETTTTVEQPNNLVSLPEGYPQELVELDVKSEKVWSKFVPRLTPGEETVIQMRYLGITVGNFTLRVMDMVKVGDVQAYHIKGILKSAKYYEMIYKIDDVIETFISQQDFVPLKFSLLQRESNKSVDDLQLFDRARMKVMHFYKREKNNKVHDVKEENFIPVYFQDFLSAIYFLRGLQIDDPDFSVEFPVYNKGKRYLSKARFITYEKVKIGDREIDAIKVGATNHFPGTKENKGEMEFWFSRDNKRSLLKMKGIMKIGEIEGEVVSHIP